MKGKPKPLPYRQAQVQNYQQRQNNAKHAKLSIDNTDTDRCFTVFSETVHSTVKRYLVISQLQLLPYFKHFFSVFVQ